MLRRRVRIREMEEDKTVANKGMMWEKNEKKRVLSLGQRITSF